MIRDKEWLKNEIEIMGSETSENYPHEQMVDREEVLNLIDQLGEPRKVIIPQFVADWWERDDDSVTLYGGLRVKKKHKFDLISKFHDKGLGDVLSEVEDWLDEYKSTFLDLVNGKPYEIEKEKLYYVIIPTKDKGWKYYFLDKGRGIDMEDDLKNVERHTEAFIRSVSDDLWPFAVEVAE